VLLKRFLSSVLLTLVGRWHWQPPPGSRSAPRSPGELGATSSPAPPAPFCSSPPFAVVKVAPYNRVLTFLGQGALLSLTGDSKVGFVARDVERVDIEVGRVLPNQLQHLAPRMWDFSRPALHGGLGRFAERDVEVTVSQ
jgi:alpha-2-macroglobulin